jgi:glutamate racemase
MGPEVILVDPAVSTSLTLKEVLVQKGILKEEDKGEENYYTTGSPEKVEKTAKIILNSDNFKIQKVKLEELEQNI